MRLQVFAALGFVASAIAQSNDTLASVLGSQPDLSMLVQAFQDQGGSLLRLLEKSRDVTILAPTNAAFEALDPNTADLNALDALLSYHVIVGTHPASDALETPQFLHTLLQNTSRFPPNNGEGSTIPAGSYVEVVLNGQDVQFVSGELTVSTVTEADIRVGGKIIHKIDNVLRIPRLPSTTVTDFGLTSIAGALTSLDLVDTIDSTNQLTVFVPTNEAFQAAGSVLTQAGMNLATQVLEYHVVAGAPVFSPDITNTTVTTLQGGDLTLTVLDGTIFVNTAKVVIPNIILSNGVAHVIDAVLNPMETEVANSDLNPTAAPTPAFSGASSIPSAPFASGVMGSTTLSVPAIATEAPAVASTQAAGGGSGGTATGGMGGGGGAASSSSSAAAEGAAVPTAMANQAVLGMGALLAGVAAVL